MSTRFAVRNWHEDAACRDTPHELWFGGENPETGANLPEDSRNVTTAKRICRGCPVHDQCLLHALRKPETYGIWGGTTRRERVPLRRLLLYRSSRVN